jgi:Protein of unknown function (DUF4232)
VRRTPIAVVMLALLTTAFTAADNREDGTIPWLPTRPPRPVEPPLSAPCRAANLRAELHAQGALGNLIGRVAVRNAGPASCSLGGRPSARFEGGPSAETPLRVIPTAADPLDTSLIYDRSSSLRALGRGRSAFVPIFWSNWCPPDAVITSTGTPPSRLVLVLPDGAELTAAVDRAPRCNDPAVPSTLAIKPFARDGRQPPASSHLPLRAAIVGGSFDKRKSPSLRVRAGGVLRYQVALTNVSRRPFRFRNCPTYVQDLDRRTDLYVLNCRPVGVLQPRETMRFAMHLRVPKDVRRGRTSVFWLLAPKTYLPTHSVSFVLVTR